MCFIWWPYHNCVRQIAFLFPFASVKVRFNWLPLIFSRLFLSEMFNHTFVKREQIMQQPSEWVVYAYLSGNNLKCLTSRPLTRHCPASGIAIKRSLLVPQTSIFSNTRIGIECTPCQKYANTQTLKPIIRKIINCYQTITPNRELAYHSHLSGISSQTSSWAWSVNMFLPLLPAIRTSGRYLWSRPAACRGHLISRCVYLCVGADSRNINQIHNRKQE